METRKKGVEDIEEVHYNVGFIFNEDGKEYKLEVRSSGQFYDIEENYIKIESRDDRTSVVYLTAPGTNCDVQSEVEDLIRPIFTAIYHVTNKLMKSKLLKKMEV